MVMRRNRILVLSLVLATSLAFAGSSQARTTNVAQLDDGTCGRNLQIGSDKTASSTATPQFLLWGDGGASMYQIFIDGTSIGTFSSDGFANVCIYTTVPLPDGPHLTHRAPQSHQPAVQARGHRQAHGGHPRRLSLPDRGESGRD